MTLAMPMQHVLLGRAAMLPLAIYDKQSITLDIMSGQADGDGGSTLMLALALALASTMAIIKMATRLAFLATFAILNEF